MALPGFSQATLFRISDVDLVPFDPFVFLKGDKDSLVASLGVLLSQKPYLAGRPALAIDILTSFARYPSAVWFGVQNEVDLFVSTNLDGAQMRASQFLRRFFWKMKQNKQTFSEKARFSYGFLIFFGRFSKRIEVWFVSFGRSLPPKIHQNSGSGVWSVRHSKGGGWMRTCAGDELKSCTLQLDSKITGFRISAMNLYG